MAVARVAEGRAQLGVTRSAQFPEINGSTSSTNQRFSQQSFPFNALAPSSNVNPQQDFYRTGIDMAFELDLWGRLRCATEASRADLFASEENRQTIRTTLISDVAQSYFDLLELDHDAQIDRRTLELRRSSLDLVRKRYESGLTAQLDVRRAEQELAVAAAAVPEIERRVVQTENRLSILLGRNPGRSRGGHCWKGSECRPRFPPACLRSSWSGALTSARPRDASWPGQGAAAAEQLVETVDLERAAFIKRYFKRYFTRDWPNRPLYDLMLNSKMGDDRAVDTIIGGIRVFDEASGAATSASG